MAGIHVAESPSALGSTMVKALRARRLRRRTDLRRRGPRTEAACGPGRRGA